MNAPCGNAATHGSESRAAIRQTMNQARDQPKNLANVSGFGLGVTIETTTMVISELKNITTTGMIS